MAYFQKDIKLGEQLKEEGTNRVLSHNGEWKESVRSVLLEVIKSGRQFTSDDLRIACEARHLPPPRHHNAWGAAMSAAAKAGLIVKVQYRKSQLAPAHARIIAVWEKAA